MAVTHKPKVDTSNLLRKLKKYPVALKEVANLIVPQEAKGFVYSRSRGAQGMVNITPPSQGAADAGAKLMGEKAVARDVARVYPTKAKVFAELKVKHPGAEKAYWAALKRRGKKGKAAGIAKADEIVRKYSSSYRMLRHAGFDSGAAIKRRRRHGKVQGKGGSFIVLNPAPLTRYRRSKEKNVGMLASGYNDAEKLKVSLPAWIKRHQKKFSSSTMKGEGVKLEVVFHNTVPFGASETKRRVRYVLGYRKAGLKRRLPYVIKKTLRKHGVH